MHQMLQSEGEYQDRFWLLRLSFRVKVRVWVSVGVVTKSRSPHTEWSSTANRCKLKT